MKDTDLATIVVDDRARANFQGTVVVQLAAKTHKARWYDEDQRRKAVHGLSHVQGSPDLLHAAMLSWEGQNWFTLPYGQLKKKLRTNGFLGANEEISGV